MKRIAGAWILFCIFAIPEIVEMTAGPGIGPEICETVPIVKIFPTRNVSSGLRKIPAEYFPNPLLFFSTAPPESLVLLPGIGPVIADRISELRRSNGHFQTWEDLLLVRGIGGRTVSKLRELSRSKG